MEQSAPEHQNSRVLGRRRSHGAWQCLLALCVPLHLEAAQPHEARRHSAVLLLSACLCKGEASTSGLRTPSLPLCVNPWRMIKGLGEPRGRTQMLASCIVLVDG